MKFTEAYKKCTTDASYNLNDITNCINAIKEESSSQIVHVHEVIKENPNSRCSTDVIEISFKKEIVEVGQSPTIINNNLRVSSDIVIVKPEKKTVKRNGTLIKNKVIERLTIVKEPVSFSFE